jgi:hypothetical protein
MSPVSPLFHAVVCLDHHKAQVLQFHADQVQAHTLKSHHPASPGAAPRALAEFFAAVADALDGVPEVLVVGSHTAQAEFRHWVDAQRPAMAAHIAGYQTVDHPSDRQLVALARQFFARHDRMVGTAALT